MHEKIALPEKNINKMKFKDFLYEEFRMTSDFLLGRGIYYSYFLFIDFVNTVETHKRSYICQCSINVL